MTNAMNESASGLDAEALRLINKFVNCLMLCGRKSIALRVFEDSLALVAQRVAGVDPRVVFVTAVENLKPHVEVRSKRVGGATYQVPCSVGSKRRESLAIRWLLEASRAKKGKDMPSRLSDEVALAYRKEGAAATKRENVHRMAEANKAFAHFA